MTRLAKILAVVAIVCLSITVIALTMSGFDLKNVRFWDFSIGGNYTDYDDLEDVNYDNTFSTDNFKSVVIDIVSANCEFIVEDRADVKVVYYGKGEFTADIRSNELVIDESFEKFKSNSFRSGSLTIYIPQDFDEDLKYKCVSGGFKGNNFKSNTLTIETISGSVELKNIESSDVSIKSISGRIDTENHSFDEAFFKTVSGKINIDAINDWSEITANSVSGSITLEIEEGSDPSVSYKSVSGDMHSDIGVNTDKGNNQSVSFSTTSGDMTIKVSKD